MAAREPEGEARPRVDSTTRYFTDSNGRAHTEQTASPVQVRGCSEPGRAGMGAREVEAVSAFEDGVRSQEEPQTTFLDSAGVHLAVEIPESEFGDGNSPGL